jgi:IS30 family transposase
MSHHQLTQTNRIEIAILFRTGMSYREIGSRIGFHHSTISRELSRHTWTNPCGYDAQQAKRQLARKRRLANQQFRKLPNVVALLPLIEHKLTKRHWSPQQIAAWLKTLKRSVVVCAQTIYDWIYSHRPDLTKYLHCRKGKYRRTRASTLRKKKREVLFAPRRIDKRPEAANSRKYYGHWEGDTVHGKGHKGYIGTLVERKSGYLLAFTLTSTDSQLFATKAAQALELFKTRYKQTLTLDNGPEMQAYELLERLSGVNIYFAYPTIPGKEELTRIPMGYLDITFPNR